MKKLLLTLLLTASFTISYAGDGPLAIRLVISEHTTAEDLQSMSDFLEANGYSLDISAVEYNSEGGVKSISGAVDFNKSSGSFECSDLTKVSCIVIKKSLMNRMVIKLKK